jgi:hypothetical protein
MPSKKRILETRNPHDVFDIVQLENGDYKVFCYDCPNKLYTIGPNETLKNFEVHLRNRYVNNKKSLKWKGIFLLVANPSPQVTS